MFINDFCKNSVQFFLKYKKNILFLYRLLVIAGISTVVLSWFITPLNFLWRDLGKISANASVAFLILTLLPGMLKRFGVNGCLQSAQVILMSYRRFTGIAMYLTAATHYLWVKFFPALVVGASPLATDVFEFMGTLALMISLPLFLTSNDRSVKFLKKNWQRLHNFVYLVLFFVVMHLWLLKELELHTLLITLTLIIETISWAKVGFKRN